ETSTSAGALPVFEMTTLAVFGTLTCASISTLDLEALSRGWGGCVLQAMTTRARASPAASERARLGSTNEVLPPGLDRLEIVARRRIPWWCFLHCGGPPGGRRRHAMGKGARRGAAGRRMAEATAGRPGAAATNPRHRGPPP